MPKSNKPNFIERYNRDDIYYCGCCGLFYNSKTHVSEAIKYTDMPAEFALQVMYDRQRISMSVMSKPVLRNGRKLKSRKT